LTTYVLLSGITAAQPAPGVAQTGQPGTNLPSGSQLVDFSKAGGNLPVAAPANVTFQAILTNITQPGATASATIQLIFSNDGINWTTGGTSPIVITTANTPTQGFQTTTNAWAYYSAWVSAVSAGGSVKCLMNA